jgi:hypothetical protein
MSTPVTAPINPQPDAGVEFRVIIRGLQLDDRTKALIDAAIRSAVLNEIGSLDPGGGVRFLEPAADPQTRSILGNPLRTILGLVLNRGPQV